MILLYAYFSFININPHIYLTLMLHTGTGSFKFRGAYNALSLLTPEELKRGVVCHSSGNHGQAVAAAAQAMGAPAAVVVPRDTPQVKVDAITGYGAEVVLCEPTQQSRTSTSEAIAERTGGTLIPPYNHVDVMAGQGTIALELLEDIPDLDAIVVPTSGGGMIAGIAAAARAIRPECRVFAAEPEGKRLQEAIAMQKRIAFPDTADAMLDTIADAIRTQPIGDVPWPVHNTI